MFPSSGIRSRILHLAARHPGLMLLCFFLTLGLAACKTGGSGGSKGGGEAKAAPPAAPKTAPAAYEKRWEERPFVEQTTSCYNCHETLSKEYGRPAKEHITSAHFRAVVTCNECHGGDPSSDDIDLAHAEDKGFIGKLNSEDMNHRCGTCHQAEVKSFAASKHFPEHEGVRRVTCLECHGAHDIGARPATFKWPANCAQCHDLENVPDLPADLVAMLGTKDAMQAKLRDLRTLLLNKPYPADVMEPYREVRQLSADIVHATKAQGVSDILAKISAKNGELEKTIAGKLTP